MIHAPSAGQRFGSRIFQAVHRRNLVYNTCWEDPALDREALPQAASITRSLQA